MTRTFDIVVACDSRRGIARAGQLPWRLPGDLKYFRKVTSVGAESGKTNAVIMGRKTWDSIPDKFRPLPNRLNIVLTRNKEFRPPAGVRSCESLDEALAAADEADAYNCFVIGGGQVYAEALADRRCRRVYLTEIEADFLCDTFLPALPERYHEQSASEPVTEGDIRYRFLVYSEVVQ